MNILPFYEIMLLSYHCKMCASEGYLLIAFIYLDIKEKH